MRSTTETIENANRLLAPRIERFRVSLWGYNELSILVDRHSGVEKGVVADTNILVSATYEPDNFHDDALAVIDQISDNAIPIFCNITVRAEFLEIHRRILFSEEILDFEARVDKTKLPASLASMLTSYRNRYERKLKSKPDEPPLRLTDSEIKNFKFEMLQVVAPKGNLWSTLCENSVAKKIVNLWTEAEKVVGINFLSVRTNEDRNYLTRTPSWDEAIELMGKHGISSSDAMILNMYLCSIFEAIVSSDSDIGIAIKNENLPNKHCLLPDDTKTKLAAI